MKHKKNINNSKFYMVYGINGCLSILDSTSCTIKKIIISKEFKDQKPKNFLLLKKYKEKVNILSRNDFNSKYNKLRTQGIIIYFKYELLNDLPDNNADNACYVILDSIKDPQNLGQIIRTSECSGINGIIIPERRSVRVTDTVLQVSQGSFCNLDIIQSKNIKYTINELKEVGFWIIGVENSIEASEWYNIDMKGKVAFIFGSEGEGIRQIIKKYCDFFTTILMHGKSNSLNISATVSAILFERNRQISTK